MQALAGFLPDGRARAGWCDGHQISVLIAERVLHLMQDGAKPSRVVVAEEEGDRVEGETEHARDADEMDARSRLRQPRGAELGGDPWAQPRAVAWSVIGLVQR